MPPYQHIMHLEPDYFDLMKKREKAVEFRILDEKRKKIKIGDKIQFICEDNTALVFIRGVLDLVTSYEFSTLLNNFPEYKSPDTKEKLLSRLRKIYNENEEKSRGVVAIVLGE